MVWPPILSSAPVSPGKGANRARGVETGTPPLPPGYVLDASDPDVLLLLREDGTTAAAFSAMGATAGGMLKAAEEDAREAKPAADRAGRETARARNGRRP